MLRPAFSCSEALNFVERRKREVRHRTTSFDLASGVLWRTSVRYRAQVWALIRRASGTVHREVVETPGTFDLPEGYRLDLLGDPDAPALRRPDGTVVARFASGGLRHEAVEREALEDLLGASRGLGEVHLRGA
jgi:hypothetical protein